MRAEQALCNRSKFDLAMREIHESRPYREALARGDARLCRARPLSGEGDLDQMLGRRRPAGAAEQIDEGAQRNGHLPVAGIVGEEPVEGGRPVLQYANQLPGAQERVNINPARLSPEYAIDPQERTRIAELNKADEDLYRAAVRRFCET